MSIQDNTKDHIVIEIDNRIVVINKDDMIDELKDTLKNEVDNDKERKARVNIRGTKRAGNGCYTRAKGKY